jgi:hypothetical protein
VLATIPPSQPNTCPLTHAVCLAKCKTTDWTTETANLPSIINYALIVCPMILLVPHACTCGIAYEKIKVTTHLAALISMKHNQLPMWTIKLPQLPDLLTMLIVSPLKCLSCSLVTFTNGSKNNLQTLECPSTLHTWQNSYHKLPTFEPVILPPSQSWGATHSGNHYLQAPWSWKEELWWQRQQQSHCHQRSCDTKYLVLTHVHWSPGWFWNPWPPLSI